MPDRWDAIVELLREAVREEVMAALEHGKAVEVIQDVMPGSVEVEDELTGLIRNAPDVNALNALFKARKNEWTAEHTRMAAARKETLTR